MSIHPGTRHWVDQFVALAGQRNKRSNHDLEPGAMSRDKVLRIVSAVSVQVIVVSKFYCEFRLFYHNK